MENPTIVHLHPTDAQSIHQQWPQQSLLPTPAHPLTPTLYFSAEDSVISHRISLWSAEVSCPGCFPSQFLSHPELQGSVRNREDFNALQELFSITKTSVYYQYHLNHKIKIQHHTSYYEENQLYLSQQYTFSYGLRLLLQRGQSGGLPPSFPSLVST